MQTMNAMSCMLPLIALARRVPFLVPFIGRLNSPHDSPASSAAPEAAALMSASSLSGGDDDKSPASSSSSLGASNAAGSQVGNAAAAAIAPASALAELTHRSGAASAAAGTSLDHGASGDSSDVALMISVRDGDAASSASASLSSPHSVLIDRSEKGGEKRDGLAASSSSSSLLSPTAWSDSAAASHSAAALSAASSAASASAADTVMATSSSSSSECAEAESYFVNLLVLSACAVAVAHGSNDVSNAVAPFAAILKSYQRHLEVAAGTARANSSSALGAGDTPFWVLVAGGLGICIGLASWGWRVMVQMRRMSTCVAFIFSLAAAIFIDIAPKKFTVLFVSNIAPSFFLGYLFVSPRPLAQATVGEKITKLTFTRGFVSQMVTATVVLAATLAGLSVSTTQVLVGSITGVALIPEDASASSSAASSASSSASPASSSEAALSTASSVEAAVATTGKGDAASGKGGLNGALVKKIALSWLITMPASALSAIAVYSLLL